MDALPLLCMPGVTDALKKGESAPYEVLCTSDLMKIVDLVRGELTNLQRATLGESCVGEAAPCVGGVMRVKLHNCKSAMHLISAKRQQAPDLCHAFQHAIFQHT